MSSNPESTSDKSEKAGTAKVVERSGFGLFGTLPFLGMNSKNGDTPADPMNVDKKQDKASPAENIKPGVNQQAMTEKSKSIVQVTAAEKVKPSVESKSVSATTKAGIIKTSESESKSNPSGNQSGGTQNKHVDKVNPAVEETRINEATQKASAKPVVAVTEVSTKPPSESTNTENSTIAVQPVTLGKGREALESMPIDEVGTRVRGVDPIEVPKPNSSKPVEKTKAAEQNKSTEKKIAAVGTSTNAAGAKNSFDANKGSEILEPVVNGFSDNSKGKTSELSKGSGKPVGQAAHSLGGESANQFTPPLPADFLKKAQSKADEIGSNITSRVNSQIPSAQLLEGKTEDLLLAPIIPRPKKRIAAKSLMKQLGHSHVTRPLKKVKTVKPKLEKSAVRVKSPGRGRAKHSKSPPPRDSSSKKARLISEGPPTEALEGGWPEGWKRRVFERVSGATKGTTDKYWYSPNNGIKLRSIVEVRRFMKALQKTEGDENEAKKTMKTIKL